jgi:hypothetical protein
VGTSWSKEKVLHFCTLGLRLETSWIQLMILLVLTLAAGTSLVPGWAGTEQIAAAGSSHNWQQIYAV